MSGSPDPKPAPRKKKRKAPRSPEEREASLRFRVLVVAVDGGCIVHPEVAGVRACEGGVLQAHHVISQQQLRHHGLDALRWDVANGVCLCEKAHSRHTGAVERVPLGALPARCLRFARRHGLEYLIERYYPAV